MFVVYLFEAYPQENVLKISFMTTQSESRIASYSPFSCLNIGSLQGGPRIQI